MMVDCELAIALFVVVAWTAQALKGISV